jgi:hypothetical protein
MTRWTTGASYSGKTEPYDNGKPIYPLRTADPHLVDREMIATSAELFLGSYLDDLIDVYATLNYGGYSLHSGETQEFLESKYTAKELKTFETYHSTYGTTKNWSVSDVVISAYYKGHQLTPKRTITAVEYGACPEANLIDIEAGKVVSVMTGYEAIYNAVKERGQDELREVVSEALLELQSLRDDLTARLTSAYITTRV